MFAALSCLVAASFVLPHEEKSFVNWMRSTNNIYTGEEYQLRFGIYLTNLRLVQEHNAVSSFKLSMNAFSALTSAEYKAILGFNNHIRVQSKNQKISKANADAIDWREKGAVTPIKDQGSCGSCWAFSAICAQEGVWAAAGNELISLSESNLVDCDPLSEGCNGGLMSFAYDYILASQGGKYMTEADYPYKAVQRQCAWDASKGTTLMKKYINITEGSEEDLAAKVESNGPVAIAIDASHFSFQLYFGGIYDETRCSSTELDHGVGCVGFGVEGEKQYWIVKNSWGSWWGEKGYIRMIKNKNNQCGVASCASQPVC